jgi:hypothetical protein
MPYISCTAQHSHSPARPILSHPIGDPDPEHSGVVTLALFKPSVADSAQLSFQQKAMAVQPWAFVFFSLHLLFLLFCHLLILFTILRLREEEGRQVVPGYWAIVSTMKKSLKKMAARMKTGGKKEKEADDPHKRGGSNSGGGQVCFFQSHQDISRLTCVNCS